MRTDVEQVLDIDNTRVMCYNKFMLVRREFDPFRADASPRDVLQAHLLLSDARGTRPKSSIGEAFKDLSLYRNFTHGATQRPPGFLLYDTPDHGTVGMAYITEFATSSTLSLDALAVAEPHRGEGFGGEILDDVIDLSLTRRLGRVSLSVDRDNKKAQQLYASRSFVIDEERDSHFYMVRRQSSLLQ